MIIPGGGDGFLSWDNEGEEQAQWLNARGVDAAILRYRLPGEGWADRSAVPLQDAQRAVRLIRARRGPLGRGARLDLPAAVAVELHTTRFRRRGRSLMTASL